MIVQVFNKYLQLGGEEKSVERIRKHAREAGFDVKKCFFDSASWQGELAPNKLSQLRKLFYNKDSAAKLNGVIDRYSPEVILLHNIYPVGSPALLDVAQKRNVPVIQYVHNFRPFSVGGTLYAGGRYCPESLEGNFFHEVKRGAWQGSVLKSCCMAIVLKRVISSGLLDNVRAWICISEYMAEAFAVAGVPKSRLHVLRHSWDIEQTVTDDDEGYYLFLGRLTEEKGIKFLLNVWDIFAEILGEGVPKLVIGGDGPLGEYVSSQANGKSYMSYMGHVEGESKLKLIRNCRAMIAPSLWKEPLGLVTYEAQEHGKAMFSANSGGLAETTQDGITGFVHEAGHQEQLIEQLLAYEELTDAERKQIGLNGRQRLESKSSPELWMNAFTEIVNGVINR